MNFDELKLQAENVAENVADWKQTNANIRKELKRKGVKCRTAFHNPQDNKAYIKQTFRKVRIEGVEQIENTYDDVLFFVCDGDEKAIEGYWDDEYIAIDVHLLLEDFETETEAEDEDIADEKFVVEFECEYGSASLSGYVYYCELDDDAPLHFYDDNGFETSILPISQDSDNEDETKLYTAFVEDFQFLQFLSDCAERSATIRREGYVLHINGGEQLSEVCTKVRSLGATETTIAFNPVHNEDGSSDAKIYYYDGSNNEMFNECFDVNVKTIGELEYLKENLPNVTSDNASTFWDNPSLLFCNGFVIQDKEFQLVDGLILFCKIEGKKLYYRTYEGGDWNEIKEESLEELKLEASKHPLGKWRYNGLKGTYGKMLYALTYHSADIKMAVMNGYDSIYCEGTSLIGDTFQLRY